MYIPLVYVALFWGDKREKNKSDTDSEILLYYYIMKGKSTLILLTHSSGSHVLTAEAQRLEF